MAEVIKPATQPLLNPTVGQLCMAQYEGNWYRGQVTSLNDDDDRIAVIFVDYGNTEWKRPSEVFQVDRDEQDKVSSKLFTELRL